MAYSLPKSIVVRRKRYPVSVVPSLTLGGELCDGVTVFTPREITISSSAKDKVSTLIHEAIHAWLHEYGLPDKRDEPVRELERIVRSIVNHKPTRR